MATQSQCLASMARLSLSSSRRPAVHALPRFLAPAATQQRGAAKTYGKSASSKDDKSKKKNLSREYKSYDPSKFPQFTLCDAMRYLRAFEVGRSPTGNKYDLAIRLRTPRSGAVIKGSVRFPNPVRTTETRFAVICPDDSEIMQAALEAGAVRAGEKALFDEIREEKINFDRLICHTSSEGALNKAKLGRILGPKGLMPSTRMRTITDNVVSTIRENTGAEQYREKMGVVRFPVGQLGFTPNQLAANVKAGIESVKTNISNLESTTKEVREVILSTSHGPGFNLSGLFDSTDEKVTPEHLSQIM